MGLLAPSFAEGAVPACSCSAELPGVLSQANTDRLPALAEHLCPSLLKGVAGAYLRLRSGLLHRQVCNNGAAMGVLGREKDDGGLTAGKDTRADGRCPEISELPPQDQEQLGWYYIAASVRPENGFLCFPEQG